MSARKLQPEVLPGIGLWPQARSTRAILKSKEKHTTNSRDREDEVSKIFIISVQCVCQVRERLLFTRNVVGLISVFLRLTLKGNRVNLKSLLVTLKSLAGFNLFLFFRPRSMFEQLFLSRYDESALQNGK